MKIPLLLLTAFLFLSLGCESTSEKEVEKKFDTIEAKVTFIELGSVRCIPCRQMQPVMKALEEKYGDQIEIVFYDVWKPEERHYGQVYEIKLIPTQVFLDENGAEFHRHEGFYPETEIDKILQSQGLKIK